MFTRSDDLGSLVEFRKTRDNLQNPSNEGNESFRGILA